MAEMTVRQILTKARAYIRKHGWCRYDYKNSRGKTCPVGAMVLAEGRSLGGSNTVMTSRAEYAFRAANHIYTSVERWNDEVVDGEKEVIAAFTRAIKAFK